MESAQRKADATKTVLEAKFVMEHLSFELTFNAAEIQSIFASVAVLQSIIHGDVERASHIIETMKKLMRPQDFHEACMKINQYNDWVRDQATNFTSIGKDDDFRSEGVRFGL